jgi:hypothetical protein
MKLLRASGALKAFQLEFWATLSEQQRERLVDLIAWRLCNIEGGQLGGEKGGPHRRSAHCTVTVAHNRNAVCVCVCVRVCVCVCACVRAREYYACPCHMCRLRRRIGATAWVKGKGDAMRLAKEGDRDAYLCFDPSRIPALKGRLPSLSSPLRTCMRMPRDTARCAV